MDRNLSILPSHVFCHHLIPACVYVLLISLSLFSTFAMTMQQTLIAVTGNYIGRTGTGEFRIVIVLFLKVAVSAAWWLGKQSVFMHDGERLVCVGFYTLKSRLIAVLRSCILFTLQYYSRLMNGTLQAV